MSTLTTEADDRHAIRDLVDAWAHCADRHRRADQAALFTADGTVTVYMGDPASNEPVQRLQGHAEMAEAFKVLDTYDAGNLCAIALPAMRCPARQPQAVRFSGPPGLATRHASTLTFPLGLEKSV